MKKIKKLTLYTMLLFIFIFLWSMRQNFSANYDEVFKDDTINVEVKFGKPQWYDDYCMFPDMSVSSQDPNKIKTIQISYAGNDTENAAIIAPDREGFTPLDSANNLVSYSTTGSVYDVQEFLRSVKYQCNNSQSITVLLSESVIPSDVHYFPGTGHFYKYVSQPGITWISAYKAALGSEVGGWRGYLAVITSKAEDDFYKKYAASNGVVPKGWLGGICYSASNIGTTSINVSNTKVGYWYWACGPESVFTPSDSSWSTSTGVDKNNIPRGTYGSAKPANSAFYNKETFSGPESNIHVVYNYSPWRVKEPNNSPTVGEGFLGIVDTVGEWNDYPNYNPKLMGYTIEYGDRLWGNSTPLEGSIIASAEVGRPVTLKYHYNNIHGTGNFEDATVYYNTPVSQALSDLPTPNVIPQDYTFEGWYTDPTGGTKVELNSNVANLLGRTYSPELNLYAHWHIGEDVTKPEIRSITLTHETSEGEKEYVSDSWTKNDVKAKYIVGDPYHSGDETSGIDTKSYYISLDGGNRYYNASSPPAGVTSVNAAEDELSFLVTLEGEYSLKIKVTDKNGNYTESEIKNLKIDKTKPIPPANVASPATSYSNVNTPTISGTGEAKCTVTIKEGETVLQTVLVGDDSVWQTTLPPLTDGEHTLSITQSDLAGNTSDVTNSVLKIDTKGPIGEINIRENKFSTFLNRVTFGMFFKDTIDVTFSASDENGSDIKTIEYLKTNSEFATKEEAMASKGWTKVNADGVFKISVNNSSEKFIIYAKITDNAGNVTCINSDGVIIYTDSVQSTSEIVFTKTSTTDLDAVVSLNGNSINKIINSTENVILTEGNHYSVSGNTITFNHDYLDSLKAGNYTLTIHYNPGGVAFNPEGTGSEEPGTTTINLKVQKATQSSLTITGINSDYTYGDNPFQINIIGGSGDGSVSYVSSEPDVADISGNTVNILKVGTFKIIATKGADVNYNEQSVQSGDIVVNPKSVYIIGLSAENKVYDATTEAFVIGTPSINGKLAQDDLTVNYGQANFTDKNAGNSKTVNFNGFSISGQDALNYTLSSQPADVLANIEKRPVTIVGVDADDKIYDGSVDATVIISENVKIVNNLDGENLSYIQGKAAFSDKSVGTDKPVSFTGFSLSGSSSLNYVLESQPIGVNANITPKTLTITNLFVENKPYDGLDTAKILSGASLGGLISGDDVSLVEGIPTFSSIDIGNDIPINFSQFSLRGAESNNYSLIQPSGITANIYEGFLPENNVQYFLNTPDGDNSWYISNNFVITANSGYLLSTENKDDSLWQNTLSYGDQGDNIEVIFYVRNTTSKEISSPVSHLYKKDSTKPTGIIQIKNNEFKNFLNTVTFGMFFKEKVDVTIFASDSLSGISKIQYFKSDSVYSDGSEIPQSNWLDGGAISNNSISFSADPDSWNPDEFNEKFFVYAKIIDYAGNICYLRSDGVVIYTDSTVSTSLVTFIKTSEKSQFASVNLNGNTIKTIFNDSYELSLNSDYKVNGPQIEFMASYLDSLKSGNYTFTIHYNPAGVTYSDDLSGNSRPLTTSINVSVLKSSQNTLEITGLDSSYIYGDNSFEISVSGANGTGSVTYFSSNPDVAHVSGNTVKILKVGTFNITAVKSADENYNEQSVQSDEITVSPKPVLLENIKVYDKIYDASNEARISESPIIVGNIDGDELGFVTGKAFFENCDAGQEKTVVFSGFSLQGEKAENYVLASQPAPIKANIEKRAVNIEGLSASDKMYDANTDATIVYDPKIINKLDKDMIEVKYGKANFSDKNVGLMKQVNFSEFDIIGDQSHNYFLESQPNNVLANIYKKDIEIVNVNVNSKIYDRTTKASFKSNPELFGIVSGDEVLLAGGTPSFTSSSVAENIPIEFTEFSIDGKDSQNYNLKYQPNQVTANITQKELVIKNIKIKDKPFDGYNTAEFEFTPSLEGIISPDEVGLSIGTPTFKSKYVAQNIPIIFTPEFSIYGKDSPNYFLAPHPQISANINISDSFVQIDPITNLWVEAPAGVFPKGSRLVVRKIPHGSEEYEKVINGLDEDKKQIAEKLLLFEIYVVDLNGNIVDPNTDNGLITVRIPVPDDFDKEDLEVYRILFDLPDDDFDEYVVTINSNTYCEFKTDHFSHYAFIDKKNQNNFVIIISVISLLLLILILISAYLIYKKFKKNNNIS